MENYQLKLLRTGRYLKVVEGIEDQLLEASYLILFVAVLLAGIAMAIYLLLELYATLSPG